MREVTAAIGIPVLVWAIAWAPRPVFIVMLIVGLLGAAAEMILLAGRDHKWHRLTLPLLGLALVFLQATTDEHRTAEELLLWLWAGSIVLPLQWLWTPSVRSVVVPGLPIQILTLISIGSFGVALLDVFRGAHGRAWIGLLLIAAWGGDAIAYYVGSRFGRHKLASQVSPKKSWEGAIAGGLATVGLTVALGMLWLDGADHLALLLGFGLLLALLGQTGDLCESMLKRAAGVKDSGAIIPGHGGLLDRFDSVFFAAPAVWVFAKWWALQVAA